MHMMNLTFVVLFVYTISLKIYVQFVCSAACSLWILKCTVFYTVYLTVTLTHIYTVPQYTQTSTFTQMRNHSFIKRPSGGKGTNIHMKFRGWWKVLNFPTWQMTFYFNILDSPWELNPTEMSITSLEMDLLVSDDIDWLHTDHFPKRFYELWVLLLLCNLYWM